MVSNKGHQDTWCTVSELQGKTGAELMQSAVFNGVSRFDLESLFVDEQTAAGSRAAVVNLIVIFAQVLAKTLHSFFHLDSWELSFFGLYY